MSHTRRIPPREENALKFVTGTGAPTTIVTGIVELPPLLKIFMLPLCVPEAIYKRLMFAVISSVSPLPSEPLYFVIESQSTVVVACQFRVGPPVLRDDVEVDKFEGVVVNIEVSPVMGSSISFSKVPVYFTLPANVCTPEVVGGTLTVYVIVISTTSLV